MGVVRSYAPVLLSRTDMTMTFRPDDFSGPCGDRVAWYRLFGRAVASNDFKARLSDQALAGTGEVVGLRFGFAADIPLMCINNTNSSGTRWLLNWYRKLENASLPSRKTVSLFQRHSIAIQRRNAVSFLGTFKFNPSPLNREPLQSTILRSIIFKPTGSVLVGDKNNDKNTNNNNKQCFV